MDRRFLKPNAQGILVVLCVALTNLRASVFWPLYPATDSIFGLAWIEIILWLLAAALLVAIVRRSGMTEQYVGIFARNWFLVLFAVFCVASLSWSISFSATLYRVLILIASILMGVHLGVRYGVSGLLQILFWFGATASIVTLALAIAWPHIAVMSGFPYYGAWRGMFWHRNHLGSIFALLNMVFLMRAIEATEKRQAEGVLDLFLYAISLVIVFLAKSATGYILVVALHAGVALAWVQQRYRDRIRPRHYAAVAALAVGAGTLVLIKLDSILFLIGRSANLTGRVPMWMDLVAKIAVKRLWYGYGYGAFWTLESNRIEMQQRAGWPFPILIGDNGFIDIFLHVGLIGLTLFLIVLVVAAARSARYARSARTLSDFFPLLFLVYAVVANLTFSLFLETESFVWMIVVAVLIQGERERVDAFESMNQPVSGIGSRAEDLPGAI